MANRASELLDRLRVWVEGLAQRPFASGVLFLFAFIEASIFPLPPDAVLVPLGMARPKRSLFYGVVCIAGSSAGALLGYHIGAVLFDAVGYRIVDVAGTSGQFLAVLEKYRENAWLALLMAGFTPIPFMVFCIAAGFHETVPLTTLCVGALLGRSIRFMPLARLLYFFGQTMKDVVVRSFHRAMVLAGAVIVLGLIVARLYF